MSNPRKMRTIKTCGGAEFESEVAFPQWRIDRIRKELDDNPGELSTSAKCEMQREMLDELEWLLNE